jgi:hypothetical protein
MGERLLWCGATKLTEEAELDALMARHAVDNSDTIKTIRDLVKERRDLDLRLSSLKEERERLETRAKEIESRVLPDLFSKAGVTSVGIEAFGNAPAYEARIGEFLRCSISSEWDEARRKAAFATCDALGLGDLLKHEVIVAFPRAKRSEALVLNESLLSRGLDSEVKAAVHWQTLTAGVKELIRLGRRPSDEELHKIGGFAGKIVIVKEREGE